MCGDSVWKAAAVKSRAHGKKDETGCMLATCRHCLLLKGLDMKRGEVYAYPYCLQVCMSQIQADNQSNLRMCVLFFKTWST